MQMLAKQIRLEIKLFFREKEGLFWTMAFPAFFIVLFGLIYGDVAWENLGIRAIDYILPGIIVMAIMTSGIMYTAQGFVEEREKGVYRRLAVTPLKRHTIMGAQIIQRYLLILAQTLILLVVGMLAFNVQIIGNLFLFWLVLTIGAICFLSIGFALAALIRSAKAASAITLIVFFFFMFLGGIFFPMEIAPDFVAAISSGLPSTHLNDAMRAIIIHAEGIAVVWNNLLVLGAWIVASLVIAVRFFRWE